MTKWVKSKISAQQGACVEIAKETEEAYVIRNSRFPLEVLPDFTKPEIVAFIQGAKDGDFDEFIK